MFNLEERRSFLKRSVLAIGVALVAPSTNVFAADTLTGVTATSKTSSGFTVKWNKFTKTYYSVSSYKVYYKFDGGTTYCRTVSSSSTSTKLTKSGWKKCQVYVAAYGSRTSGAAIGAAQILAKSSTYTFTYGSSSSSSSGLTKKLAAPTWKSGYPSVSGKKITLKWNSVSNAGSYTIEYKGSSGSWKTLKSGLKTTSYSCTAAVGTYTFRLYANSSKSGYSKSNASATKTVTVSGKKLSKPTLSVFTGSSKIAYPNWVCYSSPFTVVYCVQYRKKGALTWTTKYVQDKFSSWSGIGDCTLKGLTNNTYYQFRVKACATASLQSKGYQDSDWSSIITKKVYNSGYNSGYTPTFVDYNVSRNSYGIKF